MSIEEAPSPKFTYDPTPPVEEVEDAELSEAQKGVKGEAATMRMEGKDRASVLKHMTDAGIGTGLANSSLDTIDELMALLHQVRPDDVSPEAAAKIDALGIEDLRPAIPKLTKKPEVLLKEATQMAAGSRSKQQIVAHLTKHGVSDTEAKKVASKVQMDISTARAQFNKSKDGARNSAYWRIGLGVLMLIVGLALMGSGAESSGRRTPFGAVVGGLVMIGTGIAALSKIDSQSFEQRVREVYK